MRTQKNTWLACLLAVAMLLSLVPMTAFATSDVVTDEAGIPAIAFALVLIGGALVALTAGSKKRAAVK